MKDPTSRCFPSETLTSGPCKNSMWNPSSPLIKATSLITSPTRRKIPIMSSNVYPQYFPSLLLQTKLSSINITKRFCCNVSVLRAHCFYRFQMSMESIHQVVYKAIQEEMQGYVYTVNDIIYRTLDEKRNQCTHIFNLPSFLDSLCM